MAVMIVKLIFHTSGRTENNSEPRNFTWMNLNKYTGKVTLQFSTFDRFCKGECDFILEAFQNVTKDKCNGITFGHSYVTENECHRVSALFHSRRKGTIRRECNETCPYCEKVTELLYINYGLD
jgi:hypothetical protein